MGLIRQAWLAYVATPWGELRQFCTTLIRAAQAMPQQTKVSKKNVLPKKNVQPKKNVHSPHAGNPSLAQLTLPWSNWQIEFNTSSCPSSSKRK